MQSIVVQLFVFLHAVRIATSLSAPATTTASPWQSFVESLFPSNNAAANNDKAITARRNELKQSLTVECRQNVGYNSPEIRQRIETIMDQLATLNPTPETAASPLLKREWILEWTSEKEINFFLEKGISEEIIQTLNGDILENYIPFVKGGGFGVTGQIGVDEEREGGMRTNFKFKNANLNLGRWGEYNFPPVGEGWFDTIYLDEGLRIDTNSRNDVLICRADN
mmetsp:Transcript_24704/g.53293  ORF Transcript_24704/g.53293 Transcript_24704/m.53293 type:complete len:224 (+) Transcript_24704:49-720(+)|eukprot:CAMPEP_0172316398 /NCGR_PEP_ID=MMETSP1058-20130122/28032_1 /TAXON_ID=83371 /ORGANISM="Detonula confervacea, Strain CCMP 353" /LENGTH=223 /DNA_ID=CAMNT_0013030697 /DNA_START=42 /DNA_END=713 /DNA_ORIENTATION=+